MSRKMTMIRLKAENLLLDFQSAQLPRSWPVPYWPRVIKWKPLFFPTTRLILMEQLLMSWEQRA